MKAEFPTGKNEEYVAYLPEPARWRFEVGVDEDVPRRKSDLEVVENLLTALDGLFTATTVEYNYEADDGETERQQLTDDGGVSAAQFREQVTTTVPTEDTPLKTVSLRGPTTIRLADGDHEITRDSGRFRNPRFDHPHNSDPLDSGFGTGWLPPDMYRVGVTVSTDIWWEETAVGAVNRRRLGDALSTLYESLNAGVLDVARFEFACSWTSEESLQRRGWDDLTYSDQIAQAWGERHLRLAETDSTIDIYVEDEADEQPGIRDKYVTERVGTYLADVYGEALAGFDEVAVHRSDGSVVTGTITRDGVEW